MSRPSVSVIQVLAGALAAVSAAVLLSTLGVEGTIVGAALGSVVATGGGAWYSWSLERTHARVRPKAQEVVAKVRPASRKDQQPPISETPTLRDEPVVGDPTPSDDQRNGDHQEETPREPRRTRRWWILGLAALASFVIAMAAIVAFEIAAGKPVAAVVGGKDVGGTTVNPQRNPTPAPTESPGDQPTSPGPTVEGSPDATPSPTPTTSPASPTQTPTSSPTTANPGGQTPR